MDIGEVCVEVDPEFIDAQDVDEEEQEAQEGVLQCGVEELLWPNIGVCIEGGGGEDVVEGDDEVVEEGEEECE